MKKKTNQSKLHSTSLARLLAVWTPGMVLSTKYLSKLDIPPKTAYYLAKNAILESIGDSAYKKANDMPLWEGVVDALQSQLGIPIHVGGRSALHLHGVSQYLELEPKIWLFSQSKVNLPKWFKEFKWNFTWHFNQMVLLGQDAVVSSSSLHEIQQNGFTIRISKRERAILEMINLIGKHHEFHEVDELFEGLLTLDPQVIQSLLLRCKSIKVCRVFLYLAHKHKHSWVKNIDESQINLGTGKREIVKGGILDSRYLITVPRTMEIPDA